MPAATALRDSARTKRLSELRRMLDACRHNGRGQPRRFVPTGIADLDRCLPHGGLPTGAVTEILAATGPDVIGIGATTIALRAAKATAADSGCVVVIDTGADFYPPAAWHLGIRPDQLLVIRPNSPEQALWALGQSLHCPAVAAVVASIRRLETAASRSVQLAAEIGGTLGLLLRPDDKRFHSFATVRMRVEPVPVQNVHSTERVPGQSPAPADPDVHRDPVLRRCARLCRVTLLKVREGMPVEPFLVGLDDETGNRDLLSVPVHRPAARPGGPPLQRWGTLRRLSA